MKLIQLQVEYQTQFDGQIKSTHKIVFSGQQQNELEFRHFTIVSEEEFCELMKEMSKEGLIGNRSKVTHEKQKLTILKYQVNEANRNIHTDSL